MLHPGEGPGPRRLPVLAGQIRQPGNGRQVVVVVVVVVHVVFPIVGVALSIAQLLLLLLTAGLARPMALLLGQGALNCHLVGGKTLTDVMKKVQKFVAVKLQGFDNMVWELQIF